MAVAIERHQRLATQSGICREMAVPRYFKDDKGNGQNEDHRDARRDKPFRESPLLGKRDLGRGTICPCLKPVGDLRPRSKDTASLRAWNPVDRHAELFPSSGGSLVARKERGDLFPGPELVALVCQRRTWGSWKARPSTSSTCGRSFFGGFLVMSALVRS